MNVKTFPFNTFLLLLILSNDRTTYHILLLAIIRNRINKGRKRGRRGRRWGKRKDEEECSSLWKNDLSIKDLGQQIRRAHNTVWQITCNPFFLSMFVSLAAAPPSEVRNESVCHLPFVVNILYIYFFSFKPVKCVWLFFFYLYADIGFFLLIWMVWQHRSSLIEVAVWAAARIVRDNIYIEVLVQT